MISAMPTTPSMSSSSPTSSAPNTAPVLSSSGTAGTQEGASTYCRRADFLAFSSMNFTPSTPMTLPISWGSVQMVVVPQGRMARLRFSGIIMVLSTCMWVSMKPGIR